MTAAQWEAWVERIEIMEYESGLDRKAATLAAFALHFPADYRAMKETAAAHPDGEAALYEFLEGLIKCPRTALGGATVNAETKEVELHGNAQESPPTPRYERTRREGLAALQYVTQWGMRVTPCTKKEGGDYAFLSPYKAEYETLLKNNPDAKISDCKGFTSDIETVKRRIAEGIEIFRFIPADHGFLCLDIDKGHADGGDGIADFYRLFDRDHLPETLKDIEGGSFPCYTKTPSGGLHLYFRYDGPPVKNGKLKIAPGVEAKHGSPGLNAPGSVKAGKPYPLYGELENAPRLYPIIKKLLTEKTATTPTLTGKPERIAVDKPTPPRRSWGNPDRQGESKPQITLDTLAYETEAATAGHHDRQVSFAGRACRCKFSFSEALAYVKANPGIFGNGADTENTIESVYKDRRAL